MPSTDTLRASWMSNFELKIGGYKSALGLSDADVQEVTDDKNMHAHVINITNIIKQTLKNITTYKNLVNHDTPTHAQLGAVPVIPALPAAPTAVAAGVFDRMRSLVQRIKNAPGYSDAIGGDLGIIAPSSLIDITTICPVLKGLVNVGRPHLKWKKGVSEALDLYADHNDGLGFVLIGRFLRAEYLDITVMAAGKISDTYKYKAIYVIADVQVGLMSQVITITAVKQ